MIDIESIDGFESLSPDNQSLLLSFIREASTSVEEELKLEDAGWTQLGSVLGDPIMDVQRIQNLKNSRLFHAKDPMANQAIRIWTTYTFGQGLSWSTEDDAARKVLEAFWDEPLNRSILSTVGQSKSSDKLLVDGEIFFALFLGPQGVLIRRIDPLEITEIISDPEDADAIMFYKRQWANRLGAMQNGIYRSAMNAKGYPVISPLSASYIIHDQEAVIVHLAQNTISRRGNPLLLPALDWLKQHRRFLAARVAIMLALAKFAWHQKVAGGAKDVAAIKAVTNEKQTNSGSTMVENMGVDTTPIKTETGSKGAYNDARLLKLQICSAVGIPEQYFGDISTGNLATAKTVELPMMKQFQTYQAVWADTYKVINEIVLKHGGIEKSKWYVDLDFPPIAPDDTLESSNAISAAVKTFPEFRHSPDVQQLSLINLGINDPQKVLDQLKDIMKSLPKPEVSTVPEEDEEETVESTTFEVELIQTLYSLKDVLEKERSDDQEEGRD